MTVIEPFLVETWTVFEMFRQILLGLAMHGIHPPDCEPEQELSS